jgi:hypothetical protein
MKPKVITGIFVSRSEKTFGQQRSKMLFSEILQMEQYKSLFFALQEA